MAPPHTSVLPDQNSACMFFPGIKWLHHTGGGYLTKLVFQATIVGIVVVGGMMIIILYVEMQIVCVILSGIKCFYQTHISAA